MRSIGTLLLAAVLATATTATNAVQLDIDPQIVKDLADDQAHDASVPVDPGSVGGSGGSGLTEEEMLQKLKEKAGKSRPLISGGGDPSSGDDDPSATEDGDIDYALACEVTSQGKVSVSNVGSETMPSGVRIKWKAGSNGGLFRLNIDLEPGARAVSSKDAATRDCWATVL